MSAIINICAVVGGILSVVLALLQVNDYWQKLAQQLRLSVTIPDDMSKVRAYVVNRGPRPVTVKYVGVKYGMTADTAQTVYEFPLEPSTKLMESDDREWEVSIALLRESASKKKVVQGYFRTMWLVVGTSLGKTVSSRIHVPTSIIEEEPTSISSRPYIATDLFLGFSQMPCIEHERPVGPRI